MVESDRVFFPSAKTFPWRGELGDRPFLLNPKPSKLRYPLELSFAIADFRKSTEGAIALLA
jgi:hypothetical protein